MEELTDNTFKAQYAEMTSEELIELYRSDTLTEIALSVLREELQKRDISIDSVKLKDDELTSEEAVEAIPTSLRIIAVLFFLGGISSIIEMAVALMNNSISVNFGILGLFIGPGLLRLSKAWRTCALVFIWLALIAASIGIVVCVMAFFLPTFGDASIGILLLVIILFFVALWEYRVLTNPNIRKLFEIDSG